MWKEKRTPQIKVIKHPVWKERLVPAWKDVSKQLNMLNLNHAITFIWFLVDYVNENLSVCVFQVKVPKWKKVIHLNFNNFSHFSIKMFMTFFYKNFIALECHCIYTLSNTTTYGYSDK